MNPLEFDAFAIAARLAAALDAAAIPYAIGGAIAYGLWGDLDAGYVRRWMVDMMGEDDMRVREWDRILAEHGPR